MPTYEYECQSCGHQFDQFQNMSDDPLEVCPSCSESALKRLVGGGIGIIFKGSGFYVTDSKSSGSPKKAETKTSDSSSTTDSSAGADGSSGDSATKGKTETAAQKAG